MRYLFSITASVLFMVSCLDIDQASIIPEIEYVDHAIEFEQPGDGDTVIFGSTPYTVKLTLKVKDGDGDIVRINEDDTTKNLFLTAYRPSTDHTRELNMQMPIIANRNTLSVLIGEMQVFHKFEVFEDPLKFKDTLDYEIYIVDHADNQSNVVSIPGIIIHTDPDSNRVQ